MQSFAPQQPESLGRMLVPCGVHGLARRRVLLPAASFWVAAQLLLGLGMAAQAPTAPAKAPQVTHSTAHSASHSAAHRTAHARRKPSAAKTATHPALAQAPAPEPVVPAAPPLPNWPANNKPVEAMVVWDSHGLLVQASNSSLDQILKDISLKIGAKVEGAGADERIFGTYGPGPARDVLAQLLDGSGYNILMVGDQGAGTPRKIVLSGRPKGPAPPPGNNSPALNNDNQPDNDQDGGQRPFEPNPVMPPTPGVAPGMPVRTPQQIQQLMEERQRQIQQQQQYNQQNPDN